MFKIWLIIFNHNFTLLNYAYDAVKMLFVTITMPHTIAKLSWFRYYDDIQSKFPHHLYVLSLVKSLEYERLSNGIIAGW